MVLYFRNTSVKILKTKHGIWTVALCLQCSSVNAFGVNHYKYTVTRCKWKTCMLLLTRLRWRYHCICDFRRVCFVLIPYGYVALGIVQKWIPGWPVYDYSHCHCCHFKDLLAISGPEWLAVDCIEWLGAIITAGREVRLYEYDPFNDYYAIRYCIETLYLSHLCFSQAMNRCWYKF